MTEIFRKEALEALEEGGELGAPLQLTAGWLAATYWVVLILVAVALTYGVLGTVSEYARGPAVVRVDGRTDLTAIANGTVQSIDVRPGQHVVRNQIVVRFHAARELADLDRLHHEFELQLIKLLRDPDDRTSREALTSLRAQCELAESRVAERTLRAPIDGMVSDIRIRPGQMLTAGELVLSLLGEGARFSLVAFLPGQYRPRLRKAMTLRVELSGFPYSYQEISVDSIAEEVVGPAEAQRFLGQNISDSVPLTGPVVLVTANLPARTFLFEGEHFTYFDGLPGTAEARMREQSIIVTLVPGLRYLWSGSRE